MIFLRKVIATRQHLATGVVKMERVQPCNENPSTIDLIALAHEILDRVDANLHFMVESIKAKKYPEG